MVAKKVKHTIHERMANQPIGKWYIYIWEPNEQGFQKTIDYFGGERHEDWEGDLICDIIDQNGRRWHVAAIGTDGLLHLYKGVGYENGVKVVDVEGIQLDSEGKIVVEN